MNQEGRELVIRRILVALDASPHSLSALAAAADLAARFRAELRGVFVEDADLLRLAELPFAREISLFSVSRRQLDIHEVEWQLRAQARRVRQLLAATAARVQVSWSFRVARGAIAAELLAAGSEADLIILGKAGRSLSMRRRLGSTARAILAEGTSLTLILEENACLRGPVLVIYDGSAFARRSLVAAVALVREEDGYLIALILAEGLDEAQRLQAQVAGWLQGWPGRVQCCLLAESSVPRLVRTVRTAGCGTLVLPARSSLLHEEAILALLVETDIPVLLVR
jgi:nucleotide-binding universal stress UspA family protein